MVACSITLTRTLENPPPSSVNSIMGSWTNNASRRYEMVAATAEDKLRRARVLALDSPSSRSLPCTPCPPTP